MSTLGVVRSWLACTPVSSVPADLSIFYENSFFFIKLYLFLELYILSSQCDRKEIVGIIIHNEPAHVLQGF